MEEVVIPFFLCVCVFSLEAGIVLPLTAVDGFTSNIDSSWTRPRAANAKVLYLLEYVHHAATSTYHPTRLSEDKFACCGRGQRRTQGILYYR